MISEQNKVEGSPEMVPEPARTDYMHQLEMVPEQTKHGTGGEVSGMVQVPARTDYTHLGESKAGGKS